MEQTKLYLKPNIQVEPLFDQWYAWLQLIPPVTAALNIERRHLPIMESYINSPAMHAAAVKNPRMRGGPFIDYGGQRVDEIRQLRDRTRTKYAHMIELAQAVIRLNELLCSEAKGFLLEPLYRKIPPELAGFVDLFYDMNNNPSFRLFESLLYRSHYYNPGAQTIALSEIRGDERPFILSTPRLMDDRTIHLQLPFNHPGLDDLFRMKQEPQTLGYLRDRLEADVEHERLFESFLTTDAPRPPERYDGEGMRIRYFGHACLLLETKAVSILVDPVVSYTYQTDLPRYTYLDLPDQIDYVLITHHHQDHILFETLLQIRHKVRNLVVGRNYDGILQDPSLKLLLQHLGFESIVELREMEELPVQGGFVTGIPFIGEHHDLFINSRLAYLIRLGHRTLMIAADSCNVEPHMYEKIHQIIGDVEFLFLGMECDGAPVSWAYGPVLPLTMERGMDYSRRGRGSNFSEALDLVERFNIKQVFVYAMGQEPWLNYILSLKYNEESNPIIQSNRLIEACERRGTIAERLFGQKELLISLGPDRGI